MNSNPEPAVLLGNSRVEYLSVPQNELGQATQEPDDHQTALNHAVTRSASQLIRRKPLPVRSTYTSIEVEADEDSRDQAAAESTVRPVRTGYDPFFARKWVLLCFCALWITIIVALQILYSVSEAQQGIVTTKSSLRYLWVYGPTAIFVIVTVLWRQVDFAAKSLQPWALMSKGPTRVEHSLLLDYITPLQTKALWRALRQRHHPVSATIVVFILIKLSTIISTGLLSLQPLEFKDVPHQVELMTAFDDSQRIVALDVTSESAVTVYGAQEYNLTLPFGTTSQYAFQQAELVGEPPNSTFAYDVELEAFVPSWNYEIGELLDYTAGYDTSVLNNSGPIRARQFVGSAIAGTANPTYWNSTIKFSDCTVQDLRLNGTFISGNNPNGNPELPLQDRYRTFRLNATCSNATSPASDTQRNILAVIYDEVKASDDGSQTVTTLLNHAFISCIPDYNIQTAKASIFMNRTLNGDLQLQSSKRQLAAVSGTDIVEAIAHALGSSSFVLNYNDNDWPPALGANSADGVFSGMMLYDPTFTVEKLLDTDWLIKNSEDVYRRHAVQIAYQYLLMPVSTVLDGSIEHTESRLRVQELPLRLMQAFAACMLVVTGFMVFKMPKQVVPRSMDSIASIALILRHSQSVRNMFLHTGHLSLRDLQIALAGDQFYTSQTGARIHQVFSVEAVIKDTEATISRSSADGSVKWVQPLILRRLTLVMVLLMCAAILATLEVLNHISSTNDGLATVAEQKLERYAWLYVPVITLLLVATTFNILDFELTFIYPFRLMSHGYASARSSVLWTPLRQTAIHTFFQALFWTHWALVATSIAVIVAPILTIVASGLLSPGFVEQNIVQSVQAVSWFTNASIDGTFDKAFPIPSLLLQRNMSLPYWTSDEMAFPVFDFAAYSNGLAISDVRTVHIETPAARARVNCSVLPAGSVVNGPSVLSYDYGVLEIPLLDGCINALSETQSTNVTFMTPKRNPGAFCSVHISSATNCLYPYLAVCGRTTTDSVSDITAISCTTGLEVVRTNTTFDASTGQIVATIVDESSSAEVMEIYQPYSLLPPYFLQVALPVSNESFYNGFSEVMVYGKDGVPIEELLDPETLSRQFTHTYRQWIAQALNTYARQSIEDLPQNMTWISTPPGQSSATYNTQRQRLFLNQVSLRVLEGLLGTLMLCTLVICITTDVSTVLPKEMGSIAATASLLAGSRLVDPASNIILPETEWLSDGELKKRRPWDNGEFKMGWWPAENGSEEGKIGAAGDLDAGQVLEAEGRRFGIDCRTRGTGKGHEVELADIG